MIQGEEDQEAGCTSFINGLVEELERIKRTDQPSSRWSVDS
jgi:hypothetical protein